MRYLRPALGRYGGLQRLFVRIYARRPGRLCEGLSVWPDVCSRRYAGRRGRAGRSGQSAGNASGRRGTGAPILGALPSGQPGAGSAAGVSVCQCPAGAADEAIRAAGPTLRGICPGALRPVRLPAAAARQRNCAGLRVGGAAEAAPGGGHHAGSPHDLHPGHQVPFQRRAEGGQRAV